MDSKHTIAGRDSLGWLATSAAVPQKRKEIDGVTNSSFVNLQAQLYRTQELLRHKHEGGQAASVPESRSSARFKLADVNKTSNPGVAERDKLDRLHIKTQSEQAEDSVACLERKAALYDKLRNGELNSNDDMYEVDFMQQHLDARKRGGSVVQASERIEHHSDEQGPGGIAQGKLKVATENPVQTNEHDLEQLDEWHQHLAHKQVIHELETQTHEGRDKVQRHKARKEEMLAARRKQLKQEFLHKQVKKLKGHGQIPQ